MSSIRVRQTSYGPRYDVRYRSNWQQLTKTFRLRSDATAFKRKVDGDELAGLVTNRRAEKRLFGSYADAWLEHRLVKGRPLTPATRQGYKALLRRHLKPAFGQTKLRQITPEAVRLWHGELRRMAPDQAAKAYRVLRAILNTAVADELLGRNPCTIRGGGPRTPGNGPCSRLRPSCAWLSPSIPGSGAWCSWVGSPACAPASYSDSSVVTSTRSTAR